MELALREHQMRCVEELREGFRQGHRAQLLYAPTGFGKTEVAIYLMKAAAEKFSKTAIIMDRIVLVDQTSNRLLKYGINHGVYQAQHWNFAPARWIQVCSAQTLESRDTFPEFSLAIIDECFTGETLIDTPTGAKKIADVRCGDMVYNATGVGRVIGTKASPAHLTYRLEFEDGQSFECTANHPIFTQRGWVCASKMEVGDISISKQGLRALWATLYAEDQDREQQDRCCNVVGGLAGAKDLLKILLQEATEPDDELFIKAKDEAATQGNSSPPNKTGGQRQVASVASVSVVACARRRLAGRAPSPNSHAANGSELSTSLQSRHSESGAYDRDRIRWWFSRIDRAASTGSKEDPISCFPRLVRVSLIEHKSPQPVFNLHVEGHPSFFAAGRLVHNCHIGRKAVNEWIQKNPQMKVVGLTATPFTKGLGKIYSRVVTGSTTEFLVTNKWLAPLRVFVCKQIDMTGAKKVAGEWSQDIATERGMRITGDIVAEWIKKTHEVFGGPRKTIVFCSGVDHGADLAQQFAKQGYNFIPVSYKDDDDFKRQAIEDFAKPDTTIHGLIATDILTRGFDVPDVMIGVSARPFSKSLSSHIQQLGRVMRSHPSKEFGLWLCHSGNFLRFRETWEEVFADGVSELSDEKEKARREPTEREKKDSKCPKCNLLWPKGALTCPACGFEKRRQALIEAVAGQMQELNAWGKAVMTPQRFYSELLHYAHFKNYNPNWAAHKYREKYGTWPRGLKQVTAEPSLSTLNWVKSRMIAYAKSRRHA